MLLTGTLLQNRYQIISLLGQGGFGAVYQAHDQRLGVTVALKENLGGDPRQFQQEAQLLASLQHANLPRVSDYFFQPDGAQYLVMDFIAGEDLGAHLERAGALSEAEALRWMDQILDAVAYLHARGIIHRDIKPANIKITPNGRAVLVDFGIAKVIQPGVRTMTGAKAVSSGYAAPEQYRGGTDARSDVYSLGATLYALLIGGDPADAQARERGIATLTSPRALNANISTQTEQAIICAMALPMQQRFQSVAEMRQVLNAHISPAVKTLILPTVPTPIAPLRHVPPISAKHTSSSNVTVFSILERLMGVITLKAPVYKEIAEDKSATTTAAIIVVVMALITGILGAIILTMMLSAPFSVNPITYTIRTVISGIISWLIGGWVIAFVSKTFFGGKTETGEMLRVFGFAQIFQIIGIVPCLGTIVALALSLIAAVIGIREASEFDTTKAILTAVVAFVILVIVSMILGVILGAVGLA